MISYDFNSHSLNGETVPYCALPFHALEAAFKHEQLTQTAKNAYIALLSYAAYKNKLSFGITVTWIAEKLAITRKTASTALAQLKEFGFANDSGIVIPKTEKKAKVKAEFCSNKIVAHDDSQNFVQTKSNSESKHTVDFVQTKSSQFCSDKMTHTKGEFCSDKMEAASSPQNTNNDFVQTKCNRPTSTDFVQTKSDSQVEADENTLETMISALVATGLSRSKAESIAKVRLERSKTEESSEEKITQQMGKNYPHNNIPKGTTQENLPEQPVKAGHSNEFAATNNKANGRFSSSDDKGRLSQTRSTAKPQELLAKIGTAIKSALGDKDVRNSKGYVTAALKRMTVRSQTEIDRYYAEIIYAIQANQMQTIKGCLWLIEQGKWKAPAGMY